MDEGDRLHQSLTRNAVGVGHSTYRAAGLQAARHRVGDSHSRDDVLDGTRKVRWTWRVDGVRRAGLDRWAGRLGTPASVT